MLNIVSQTRSQRVDFSTNKQTLLFFSSGKVGNNRKKHDLRLKLQQQVSFSNGYRGHKTTSQR